MKTPSKTPNHLNQLIIFSIFTIGVLAGSILVFELFFRLLSALPVFSLNLDAHYELHPRLGWTQLRGGSSISKVGDQSFPIEYNLEGYRDIYHNEHKPENVKRIVILGDSFSEALQVPFESTYHQKLKQNLDRMASNEWEIIQLGVGDYGNFQSYLTLLEVGLNYQPDLIIHQIFPMNDVCNNAVELAGRCLSPKDDFRPYASDCDASSVRYTSPLRAWLRTHSVFFAFTEIRLFRLKAYLLSFFPHITSRLSSPETLHSLLLPELKQPDYAKRAWTLTECILDNTIHEARSRDIPYLAMICPHEAWLDERSQKIRVWGDPIEVEYANRRLSAFFESRAVSTVFLEPLFVYHYKRALPFIDGHMSEEAHRLAADALFEAMKREGLIQTTETKAD